MEKFRFWWMVLVQWYIFNSKYITKRVFTWARETVTADGWILYLLVFWQCINSFNVIDRRLNCPECVRWCVPFVIENLLLHRSIFDVEWLRVQIGNVLIPSKCEMLPTQIGQLFSLDNLYSIPKFIVVISEWWHIIMQYKSTNDQIPQSRHQISEYPYFIRWTNATNTIFALQIYRFHWK